jgi:hypothetical protein
MEGEREAINSKLFTDWVNEVFSKEKGYRKLLSEDSELRTWYAKHWHPTTKKCGRESIEQDLSRLVPGSVITLDRDEWELDSCFWRMMMMIMLKIMLAALLAVLAAQLAVMAGLGPKAD